jgi:hypothetical protein
MARRHRSRKPEVTPAEQPIIPDSDTTKSILYIVGVSLLMKLVVFFITTVVFGSFLDTFGISYYYEHVMYLVQGQIPYIQYDYEYPILVFIPSLIAVVPALLMNSQSVFIIAFTLLMVACDCVTAACVYLIAKKIWDDDRRAFIAAILYTTALSAMYFSLVEYSPFASSVLMVTLTAVIYGKDISLKQTRIPPYFGLIIGFFIKIYPAIALPFVAFYNAHTTSLKHEIVSAAKVIIPVVAVLFVPFVLLNPQSITTYIPARLDFSFFPNTIIWTAQVWLHDIFRLSITKDQVLIGVYACMAASLLTLLYFGYKYPEKDPKILLKLIVTAIVIVVVSFKVRSPQYIIWFTPFFAILVIDDIRKIAAFYIVQILAFIEFPLTFYRLWTNIEYTNPIYSPNWQLTVVFFTVEFAALLVLTWWVLDPISIYRKIKDIQKPVV